MQSPERIHLNKDPNVHRSTFNKQVRKGHVLFLGSIISLFPSVFYWNSIWEKCPHVLKRTEHLTSKNLKHPENLLIKNPMHLLLKLNTGKEVFVTGNYFDLSLKKQKLHGIKWGRRQCMIPALKFKCKLQEIKFFITYMVYSYLFY